MTVWVDDLGFARRWWQGAADFDDVELAELLAMAQEQCEAYAPALAVDAPVPMRYRMAVVYQARDVYSVSQRQGEGGNYGDPDYPIVTRPLSPTIKQLLRPMTAVPKFGGHRRTVTP